MNPIEKLGALANDNIQLINMTSRGLLSKGWFNINGKICLVKGILIGMNHTQKYWLLIWLGYLISSILVIL